MNIPDKRNVMENVIVRILFTIERLNSSRLYKHVLVIDNEISINNVEWLETKETKDILRDVDGVEIFRDAIRERCIVLYSRNCKILRLDCFRWHSKR